jgi:hypothetical protein
MCDRHVTICRPPETRREIASKGGKSRWSKDEANTDAELDRRFADGDKDRDFCRDAPWVSSPDVNINVRYSKRDSDSDIGRELAAERESSERSGNVADETQREFDLRTMPSDKKDRQVADDTRPEMRELSDKSADTATSAVPRSTTRRAPEARPYSTLAYNRMAVTGNMKDLTGRTFATTTSTTGTGTDSGVSAEGKKKIRLPDFPEGELDRVKRIEDPKTISVFERIRNDHCMINDTYQRFKDITNDVNERREVGHQLIAALLVHDILENDVMYPVAKKLLLRDEMGGYSIIILVTACPQRYRTDLRNGLNYY